MTRINVIDVARYLVASAHQKEIALTNMQVLKLLYYAQGWFLALYGQPLFQEKISAWKQGPVVVSIWMQFKRYKGRPINPPANVPDFSEPVRLHLERIVETFGNAGAMHLKWMTHAERPWRNTRSNTEIPLEAMREFFQELMQGAPVDPQYEWAREALKKRAAEEEMRFQRTLDWVNEKYGEALERLAD